MPIVRVKEGEPSEVALRRFKRACEKAGVLSELRRREAYEKPTSIRKRKRAAAVKRHQKKLMRENPFSNLRGGKKPDKRKQHLSHNAKKSSTEEPKTEAV